MEKTTFGRMGDQISRLGFGAWAIGSKSYGKVERTDALAALETYVNSGGNFIDTARGYGNSEQLIGEFMKVHGIRSNLFICSKTPVTEEEVIRKEVETTISNLGTDYIDLYYLHAPPDNPDQMNRVLDIFSALKKEGKIRGIGASIKGPNVTSATQELCSQYIETGKVDAIQLIFSVFRQKNRAIFEQAKEAGVALVGRTVLENGFLTGKYKPGHRFQEGDHRNRWSNEKLDQIFEDVANLAQNPACSQFESLAQLAIKFAFDEELLATIIIGARNQPQTMANIKASNLSDLPADWSTELIKKYAENTALGNL